MVTLAEPAQRRPSAGPAASPVRALGRNPRLSAVSSASGVLSHGGWVAPVLSVDAVDQFSAMS
jgi:hypothetical protein